MRVAHRRASRLAAWFGRWSGLFGRLVEKNVGRIYTCLVGTAVVVASSFFVQHTAFATTALVTGSALVGIGAMAPWLRSLKWAGGSVEMESPVLQEARVFEQKAKVAKEVSDELDREDISVDESEALDATRYLVASLAAEAIISEAARAYSGFSDCEFRFFMFDAEQEKLFAVLRPDQLGGGQRGWRRSEGVTGLAYDSGQYQIATGSATHDGTHNLDSERQRRYVDLTEVAAMPVQNALGVTIGVLSVSHTTGRTILATDESRRAHSAAADALARVVVDLLGWRSDESPARST